MQSVLAMSTALSCGLCPSGHIFSPISEECKPEDSLFGDPVVYGSRQYRSLIIRI